MGERAGGSADLRRVRRRRLSVVTAMAAAVAGTVWLAESRNDDGAQLPDDARAGDPAAVATGGTTAATTGGAIPAGPPDQATLDGLELRLEPVVEVGHPTAVVQHPGTGDLYVSGAEGPIVRVPADGTGPATVADFGSRISTQGESGLLDIAFNAGGDLLYASLVETDGDLALLEIPSSSGQLAIDRARPLLTVPSPTEVHHAGDVDVDAAGMLWYSIGDGGPSQAHSTRAQNLADLHGKILRIDPRPTIGAPYQIPLDNPFAGRTDARPEIWAYGLRNPWRFEFDAVTGDLWIGDVGRNDSEEIDHLPGPQAGAGANLGWPYFEGSTAGLDGAPPGLVPPIVEYAHGDGERCAVTGGAVYRGDAIPSLRGAYLYSDLCDGIVRAVSVARGVVVAERALQGVQAGYPVSFGTDLAGEMYLCSFDLNTVFRIVAA